MSRFTVHIYSTVSASVDVDAESVDDALDSYWNAPDMPGSITHQAFGDTPVDHDGEWQPVAVYAEDGRQVWSDVRAGDV